MATYTDNYNLTKPTFAESADIRTINGNMDTIDAVMHASQVSLADAYDETRTASNPYKKDDIVMYELLMYKCLEDGVYGTWDGTKWERTTAGANGGGSDVEVTPSYNSGTKIAEIDVDGDTEEIYVPEMTGASSSSDGTAGLPPAPEAGDEDKFFKGDGTWAEVGGGADYVELTQAEYDALSPAEKMNGKMYFITDASGGGGGGGSSEGINYSTEEQDTGIKWIDGKTIYQKTFSFSDGDYQLQRNSWTAISSVSIPTLENVVDIRMIGYDTANKYPAVEDGCSKRFVNGVLNYYLDKDFPMYLRAVTVQYTKSST